MGYGPILNLINTISGKNQEGGGVEAMDLVDALTPISSDEQGRAKLTGTDALNWLISKQLGEGTSDTATDNIIKDVVNEDLTEAIKEGTKEAGEQAVKQGTQQALKQGAQQGINSGLKGLLSKSMDYKRSVPEPKNSVADFMQQMGYGIVGKPTDLRGRGWESYAGRTIGEALINQVPGYGRGSTAYTSDRGKVAQRNLDNYIKASREERLRKKARSQAKQDKRDFQLDLQKRNLVPLQRAINRQDQAGGKKGLSPDRVYGIGGEQYYKQKTPTKPTDFPTNIQEYKYLKGLGLSQQKALSGAGLGSSGEPKGYKEALQSAIGRIQKDGDPWKEYQSIASKYPKKSSELKRILVPAQDMSELLGAIQYLGGK